MSPKVVVPLTAAVQLVLSIETSGVVPSEVKLITVEAVTHAPAVGAVMATTGAAVSLVTATLTVVIFAAQSVSRTYSVIAPWAAPANCGISPKVVVPLTAAVQLVLSIETSGVVPSL